MPIEIRCPHCRRRFRVPDRYAGKRVKCPKCEGTIAIRAVGEPSPERPAPGDKATKEQVASHQPAAQRWFLQTEDGQHFGPVSRTELDAWLTEGRIDASCQLLCEGWKQWKWADQVYPELADGSTGTPQAGLETEKEPFADIGGEAVQGSQSPVNPYLSPREPSEAIQMQAESEEREAITPRMRSALAQTRPWVLFLSILGFIGGGLMVLAGLGMLAMTAMAGGPGISGIEALGFVVASAVYLAPAYYLLRYAQRIGHFVRSSGPRELEAALAAQKSFWKLVGILALVLMALYGVMIVIAVLVGLHLS